MPPATIAIKMKDIFLITFMHISLIDDQQSAPRNTSSFHRSPPGLEGCRVKIFPVWLVQFFGKMSQRTGM